MTKTDGAKFKIKETLLEFMKRKSIDQIKVIDITNELKINRSTFYLYYDSIYDPLQEIEDVFLKVLEKLIEIFLITH